MHLSEVLGAEVRDGNNRKLGVVRDVRATAVEEEGGRWASVRLDALVIASRWTLRFQADRPAVLRWFDRRFERSSRTIAWDRIESVEDGIVRVRASR